MTKLLLLASLTGCFPAGLFSGSANDAANKCVADMKETLTVPQAPPMRSFAGRWSCVFQGPEGTVTEYLQIDQHGADVDVRMHDLRGGSNIGQGRVGGNVLAFQLTAGRSGVRFEGDDPRVIKGYVRWYNADDCTPHPYTCMQQ